MQNITENFILTSCLLSVGYEYIMKSSVSIVPSGGDTFLLVMYLIYIRKHN